MSHVTIRPSVCINSVVNCGLIGGQYNVVLSQIRNCSDGFVTMKRYDDTFTTLVLAAMLH